MLAINKEKEIERVKEADIPPLVAMLMSHDSLKEMDEEKRLYWATFAVRNVDNCIELFEEPESQSQLQDLLVGSHMHQLRGVEGQDYVLIHLDQKQTGEAVTSPHIRIAPCREKHITKMLGGILGARQQLQRNMPSIVDGDMLVTLDGGRHNIDTIPTSPSHE